MALEPSADTLEAIAKLVKALVEIFGVKGFLSFLLLIIVLSIGKRIYNDRRKDNEVNLALDEKDRTIQRLAEDKRLQRILIFKKIFIGLGVVIINN